MLVGAGCNRVSTLAANIFVNELAVCSIQAGLLPGVLPVPNVGELGGPGCLHKCVACLWLI